MINPENVTVQLHAGGAPCVIANLPSGLAHDFGFEDEVEAIEFVTDFYGIPAEDVIVTEFWALRPWESGPKPENFSSHRLYVVGEVANASH